MGNRGPDWPVVMDRLVRGEGTALLEVSRLITGFPVQWQAHDFRHEWDDLIQEVGAKEGPLLVVDHSQDPPHELALLPSALEEIMGGREL